MFGGVGWTLADSESMKLSVKLTNSIGRSSRSTEARGGSGASSSPLELSKTSGGCVSTELFSDGFLWVALGSEAAPFLIVLVFRGRVALAVAPSSDPLLEDGLADCDCAVDAFFEGEVGAMRAIDAQPGPVVKDLSSIALDLSSGLLFSIQVPIVGHGKKGMVHPK